LHKTKEKSTKTNNSQEKAVIFQKTKTQESKRQKHNKTKEKRQE